MLEELKELICEYVEVKPEEITEDSRFIEDLGFNSYDFMSMVGEIEERYDIEVEEREVVNVKTVEDAIKYIRSLQEGEK
ncbi:MAG: acyl carrier protein [Enterocloster sp.]